MVAKSHSPSPPLLARSGSATRGKDSAPGSPTLPARGLMGSGELPRSTKTRYKINPNFSDALVTTNCFPDLIFPLFCWSNKKGKINIQMILFMATK